MLRLISIVLLLAVSASVAALDDTPFEAERLLRLGDAAAALGVAGRVADNPAAGDAIVAEASVLKGRALDRLERWQEAEALFARVARDGAAHADPKVRYQAAGAGIELGTGWLRRGQFDKADAIWTETNLRFSGDAAVPVRETAHAATVARVMARAERGDVAAAMALAQAEVGAIAPDAVADRIALRDTLLSLLFTFGIAGPMIEEDARAKASGE